MVYRYRVDSENRIEFVDAEWQSFATENSAEELCARVLGTPYLEHVEGDAVRYIYKQLIEKVRSGHMSVRFPFRCDGPEVRRFMQMEIVPLEDGRIEFITTLLREVQRERVPSFPHASDETAAMLVVCAWCKRVRASDWLEIEDAIAELALFDEEAMPPITHGICEDCLNVLESELPSELSDADTVHSQRRSSK